MRIVTSTPARSIQTVMKRLAAIAGTLTSKGLVDEAKSLETTIADLTWQCEELHGADRVMTADRAYGSPG